MKTNNKSKGVAKSTGKKASRITLGTHQDIAVINNLYGRLKKCAAKQVNVTLIAENVESIDTATLQLLLSFVQQVQNNGNTIDWQSPPPVLFNSARQIGVDKALLLPQTME